MGVTVVMPCRPRRHRLPPRVDVVAAVPAAARNNVHIHSQHTTTQQKDRELAFFLES
jgi:hypothetical protein